MRYVIAILLLCLFLPCAAQDARKETFTQAQFLSAAGGLRRAPLGKTAKADTEVVITWTIESPLVSVEFTPAVQELAEAKDQACASLIAAFASGQAQAQLRAKAKGGFSVEGGKEVIAVYRAIQKADPSYVNQGAEKMIAAQNKGQLEAYLAAPPNGKRVPLR